MHNLFRLSSMSRWKRFFYKQAGRPRTAATVRQGLIATTSCPSGEVQTYLQLGQYDEALASAAEFRDIFGAENATSS